MEIDRKMIQEGDSYQALKTKTSIAEILETASSFEYTAFIFYSSLQDKIDPSLRPFVQELAEEEKNHFELFQGLSRHPHALAHYADLVKTPPGNHRFTDYVRPPPPTEFPDNKAIFLYAMGREQTALEQYSALAQATEGPIQDLFYYLAHEEMEHVKKLQKRYEELTSR